MATRGRSSCSTPGAEAHDAQSFETAVEATASVVDRLTRMRRRVGGGDEQRPVAGTRPAGDAPGSAVMDRLATIEPGGADRLADRCSSSLRAHRRAPRLVVAVVGSLTAAELNALGALTAYGAVTMVATRPPLDVPPGDRFAPATPASVHTALVLVDTYAARSRPPGTRP